jgi:aminoglycoside phosphotransferase
MAHLIQPPTEMFPTLSDWQSVGINDAVFKAVSSDGETIYVRSDDGSASLLRRLERISEVPAPRVIDRRHGWLLLAALPGLPLNDDRWLAREGDAMAILADALMTLDRNGLTHGDMCLPNVLGDLEQGGLSGIVDWRDTGRFERIIDVASAVWSCTYNGYSANAPTAVLRAIGWPRADAAEVERLSRTWIDLAGPAD